MSHVNCIRNAHPQGRTASWGFAHGPLVLVDQARVGRRTAGSSAAEERALRGALAETNGQIKTLASTIGGDAAEILEFQLELLDDKALLGPIFAAIAAGAAADDAWSRVLAEQIAHYRAAPDEYLQARAADLIDLRDRVLAALNGELRASGEIPAGAVVCAEDLPPSRFLEIDWSAGGGLALSHGSAASHVAMLARARGVPMVVQLGRLPAQAGIALLDGEQATLELDPPPARIADFAARRSADSKGKAAASAVLAGPPVIWRGDRVRLHINIQDAADLGHPDAQYSDGIGLMRTEFLFDDPAGLPDEDKQFGIYEAVLRWAGDRPVTIRTVDAGGDKPIRGFTEDGEMNPFLGVRGLRLSLKRPEIFAVQLRALARAAVHGKLKVMFPMVTVPAEFTAARDLFREVVAQLLAAGRSRRLAGARHHGRGAGGGADDRRFPCLVLLHRLERSHAIRYGKRPCERRSQRSQRPAQSRRPRTDPPDCGAWPRRGASVSLCGDMAGDPRCAACAPPLRGARVLDEPSRARRG